MATFDSTSDDAPKPQPRSSTSAPFPSSWLYQRLTDAFNAGRCRTILSSGQACVLHRISFASKDGDWLVREDDESLAHTRALLGSRGARYRLGAPLDRRWLAGGWSSHLEFQEGGLRVRTDFVSRPPRVASARLEQIWREADADAHYVLPIPDLIAIKRSMRERDYPIIGALAMRLGDPPSQLLFSQSPELLARLIAGHSDLAQTLAPERHLLAAALRDPGRIPLLLFEERSAHQERDRHRMRAYADAVKPWAEVWQRLAPEIAHLPLEAAHHAIVQAAHGVLPERIAELP